MHDAGTGGEDGSEGRELPRCCNSGAWIWRFFFSAHSWRVRVEAHVLEHARMQGACKYAVIKSMCCKSCSCRDASILEVETALKSEKNFLLKALLEGGSCPRAATEGACTYATVCAYTCMSMCLCLAACMHSHICVKVSALCCKSCRRACLGDGCSA